MARPDLDTLAREGAAAGLADLTRGPGEALAGRIAREALPALAARLAGLGREVHDLLGLVPRGHPDPRRLALRQFWPEGYHPLRRDAGVRRDLVDAGQPFPFRRVEGEGIFEITVGPVHAGIIEPGHFRFSVEGETVVNLETRLGFVHKGIEKLFETLPWERTTELAERVSGDESAAHALAWAQAVETLPAASSRRAPPGCASCCWSWSASTATSATSA